MSDYDDEWTDDAADEHDERHAWWHEGCDECVERANWLEAQYRDQVRQAIASER